jgi:hemoglobin-like flavoprotein
MGVTRHPLFSDGNLPGVPSDRAAIRRVRASLAWLLAQKTDVVSLFYAVLFVRHPALRELFPGDLDAVQCRMRAALALYVARLHAPETLAEEMGRLGRLHLARGVRPEHYPLACECFIEAMQRVSGPQWNAELEHDWRETLRAICATMLKAAPGGGPVSP